MIVGFVQQLNQLLRRGIRFHIGYGLEQCLGEHPVAQADEEVEAALDDVRPPAAVDSWPCAEAPLS